MSDIRDIAVKYAHLLSASDYSILLNKADEIERLEAERDYYKTRHERCNDYKIELEKALNSLLCEEIWCGYHGRLCQICKAKQKLAQVSRAAIAALEQTDE